MARKPKTPRTSSTKRDPEDPITSWAEDVCARRIVAGPHVRNACRRHLQDYDDWKRGDCRGLHWDLAAALRSFRFFENMLKLNGGQFEGIPFKLHPSQMFQTGSLFGWKQADGSRRFRRAYIEQAKGNGKSPWAAGIGHYCLIADDEARAEVYAAAATKDQAFVLFRDAVAMYEQSPKLNGRLTKSGGNPVWNLADVRTASFFRPISSEMRRSGSGPRPSCALCDEVHEHPDGLMIEMLERGFKWRRQPLLVMTTNSGSDRNSMCWAEHQHAVSVAAGTPTPDEAFTYVGEIVDDAAFSFVCALDPGDDPLTDPSCWIKANPLLGITVKEDYLAGVVRQAQQIPGKLNGILRLHFCQWTDAETAWISRPTLEACLADFDPVDHSEEKVFAGADLSATQDITALAFVVETGTVEVQQEDGTPKLLPTYDAWIEAWTPGDTLAARALQDKAPYDVWVKDGWLNAPPGKVVRMDYVAARVAEASTEYEIEALAYDRYAFRKNFEPELDAMGLTIALVEHPQGGKRRARPTEAELEEAKRNGEEPPQGLWMPGSLVELENLLLEQRIRLRRNPVLISAMMSAVVEKDAFDNRWFSKRKATNRIDALVALAMAVGAATAGPSRSRSVYEKRGFLVI